MSKKVDGIPVNEDRVRRGARLLTSAEKETVDQPNRNQAERENCCGPDRVALNSSMMPRNHFICHMLKPLGAEVVTDILFALLGKFQVSHLQAP